MKFSLSSFAHFGEIEVQIATAIVLISTLLALYANFSLRAYNIAIILGESQGRHFTGFETDNQC